MVCFTLVHLKICSNFPYLAATYQQIMMALQLGNDSISTQPKNALKASKTFPRWKIFNIFTFFSATIEAERIFSREI